MSPKPNVGEYWYAMLKYTSYNMFGDKDVSHVIRLSKIEGYVGEEYVIVSVEGVALAINLKTILRKWEPNFFFKLLGYK